MHLSLIHIFTLITGAVDIGPGAKYTSLPQLVADELKLRPEDVIVSACDTDTSPYDHGDGGSRMTYNVGRACQMAAEDLRTVIPVSYTHLHGHPRRNGHTACR